MSDQPSKRRGTSCFNEAAPDQERKCPCLEASERRVAGFNEAAPDQERKCLQFLEFVEAMSSLQ